MAHATPPVEWVAGNSGVAYAAGNFLVLFGGLALGGLVAQAAFPFQHDTSLMTLLLNMGVRASIAVPVVLLYALSVPCPHKIGISPTGLSVDFGLRTKTFSWQDVHPRNGEALCFARWYPWPERVALSPYQQFRIASFFGTAHR